MTDLYFYNLNVGSGIEATGDRVISMLDDYPGKIHVYKHQNPPYLLLDDLIKVQPDVIVMNEYYPRVLEGVYYYKVWKPKTKVILLNHDWLRSTYVPYDIDDPKGEHRLSSHDQVALLNTAWHNTIDIFITLNHRPEGRDYPEWVKYKTVEHVHPIPDAFNPTMRWKNRRKDFMYYGVLWPHKFSRAFIEAIDGSDIYVDLYGNIREDDDESKEYNQFIANSRNVQYMGYIPDHELINRLNEYRFWVFPREGHELFCLCMAEALRCNVIPLVVNPPEGNRPNWADWASGCYFRYHDIEELIDRMKHYLSQKNDPEFIERMDEYAEQAGARIRSATDYKEFKKILYRYIII